MLYVYGLGQKLQNKCTAVMTSPYCNARYAIWHHETQHIQGSIEWRVTPKSKDVVAVVPPARISGQVVVTEDALPNRICVALDDAQVAAVSCWLSGLPAGVIRPTAETDGSIVHDGAYVLLDGSYNYAGDLLPSKGDRVAIRVVPDVTRIGSLRKAQLRITDVLLGDVSARRAA